MAKLQAQTSQAITAEVLMYVSGIMELSMPAHQDVILFSKLHIKYFCVLL